MRFRDIRYITPTENNKYEITTKTTTELLTVRDIVSIASKDAEGIKCLLSYIISEKFHDLVKANLANANLKCADLANENLMNANLKGADLRGADLSSASLVGANLRCADLRGADLRGADLAGANLSNANLRCANLANANLKCADLGGVNLSSANLRGADLYNNSLYDALGDGEVIITLKMGKYTTNITKDVIQIGCERYTHSQWLNFSDEEIRGMDKGALNWWGKYKDFIFRSIELSFGEEEN